MDFLCSLNNFIRLAQKYYWQIYHIVQFINRFTCAKQTEAYYPLRLVQQNQMTLTINLHQRLNRSTIKIHLTKEMIEL